MRLAAPAAAAQRSPTVVVVAVFFIAAVSFVFAGCPADPPPPPVDECPAGQSGSPCAFPWEATCASASAETGCVDDAPTRCDVDDATAVPAYDCEACGCGAADACTDAGATSLCLTADVREGERGGPLIDDGLEDAEYVALFRRLHGLEALTLDEVLDRLEQRRSSDPRRSVVVLGSDEAGLSSVVPAFFDGSFGAVLSSNEGCDNVDAGLLPDDGRVLVTAADTATDVTCLHPGVFARCTFPPVAGCALVQGLLPETLVILGSKAIADVDNALLRHAARAGRDEWLARFDAQIGLFTDVFLGRFDARFAHPTLPGTLRFIVDEDAGRDDVVFGLLADDPDPTQLRTFRLMWVDASVQLFLVQHDITPSQCAFVVVADDPDQAVDVDCAKNGARVSGRVVLRTNDLSGLTLDAP